MSKRIIAGALAGAVLASTMAPMGVYADSPEVNIWVSKVNATDSGMEKGLEKQTPVHFGSGDSASTNNLIVVDENNTYQTVDGFGASITEASAHLYQTNLDDSAKAAAMQAPIDLLSGATLHLMKGHDWRQNHYVSLGGLNYVALDNYLENHPEIHKLIYKPLIKSGYKIACPTLTDLYNDLKEQPHERAHEIALALELFATGSMNMFAHPTNVDMSNRLICFNIQSLGDQLKPVAMLSMLEYINTCVMSNERNDPKAATWVYFDEIYLLLRDKLSSQFLYTSWKRFRKYNAYATGITQNVQDCLSNDTAYAMLANSEFVCMLRQTKDIDSVVELYGLSDPQKNYLKLAKPGQGILKMGNNLIPFVNDHPTNTKIYRLLTTKPGEMEN